MRISRRGRRRLLAVVTVLVLLAIAGTIFIVARGASDARLAVRSREAGLEAYQRGDYDGALEPLSYVLQQNNQDLECLLAFADSRARVFLVNDQHLFAAASHYRAALDLDPTNADALRRLLDLFSRLGYRAEAEEIVDRILRDVDPNDLDALAASAGMRFADGDYAGSMDALRRLIELEPAELTWRFMLFEVMRIASVPPEEMHALADAWIADPASAAHGRLVMTRFLLDRGQADAAADALLAAAAEGAADGASFEAMIRLFDDLILRPRAGTAGDTAQIVRLTDARDALIDRVREEHGDQAWVYEAAVVHDWRAGRLDEAMQQIKNAEAAIDDPGPLLLRWKALLLAADGQREAALAVLKELEAGTDALDPVERDRTRGWVAAIDAELETESLPWADRLHVYGDAIDLAPADPMLHFLLARAYQDAGERELAARMYARAAALDPLWVAPQIHLAEVLLDLDRPIDALERLARMRRRLPRLGVQSYLLMARAWLASGRSAVDMGLRDATTGELISAVGLLEALRDNGQRLDEVMPMLVAARLRAGDVDGARNEAVAVAMAEPPDVDVLVAVASVCDDPMLAGVRSALLERAETAGGTTSLTILRAELAARSGDPDAAIRLLDGAEASDRSPEIALRRAVLLARAGRPEAAAALSACLETPGGPAHVLATPEAWAHAPVVRSAVDRLEAALGPDSLRVMIARARLVLEYESDDPARVSEAIGLTSNVLQRAPNSLPALALMSSLLLTGDDVDRDKAMDYLRRAVDRYPRRWELYPRLIGLLQARRDYEVAEQYLDRLGGASDLPAQVRRAEIELLRAQGDLASAIDRLEATITDASEEADRLTLASWYRQVGRHEDAARLYEAMLDVGGTPLARRQAAGFYASRGQRDEAIRVLEAIDAGKDSIERDYRLAEHGLEYGDQDAAVTQLRDVIAREPEHLEARATLARHLLRTGDVREAHVVAAAGLERDPDHPYLRRWWLVSGLEMDGPPHDRALDHLRQTSSPNAAAWLATQTLADRIGDDVPSDRELSELHRLLRDHASFAPGWELAFRAHVRAGMHEDALAIARRATVRVPGQARSPEWSTRLLVQLGRTDEALRAADTWRRRSLAEPIVPDTIIASLLLDDGRADRALAQLAPHDERIERQAARHPERLAVLIRAQLLAGDVDEAARLAGLSDAIDPAYADLWLAIARTTAVETSAASLARIEPLLLEDPAQRLVLAGEWALLARRSGDPAHFEHAETLAQGVSGADAILLRASIAEGRGDLQAAEALYREVLAQTPEDVIALNNLASVLLERGDAYEALELSERAIAATSDVPALHDTRARAMLAVGRAAEAEASARRAAELDTRSAVYRITLARVLLALDRSDEARDALAAAEALAAGDAAILERIAELRRTLDESGAG